MTQPDPCEHSATRAGWFRVTRDMWLHAWPWFLEYHPPPFIIGTARDVCLLNGLETGDSRL